MEPGNKTDRSIPRTTLTTLFVACSIPEDIQGRACPAALARGEHHRFLHKRSLIFRQGRAGPVQSAVDKWFTLINPTASEASMNWIDWVFMGFMNGFDPAP